MAYLMVSNVIIGQLKLVEEEDNTTLVNKTDRVIHLVRTDNCDDVLRVDKFSQCENVPQEVLSLLKKRQIALLCY